MWEWRNNKKRKTGRKWRVNEETDGSQDWETTFTDQI